MSKTAPLACETNAKTKMTDKTQIDFIVIQFLIISTMTAVWRKFANK